jgi:hypothetical protein
MTIKYENKVGKVNRYSIIKNGKMPYKVSFECLLRPSLVFSIINDCLSNNNNKISSLNIDNNEFSNIKVKSLNISGKIKNISVFSCEFLSEHNKPENIVLYNDVEDVAMVWNTSMNFGSILDDDWVRKVVTVNVYEFNLDFIYNLFKFISTEPEEIKSKEFTIVFHNDEGTRLLCSIKCNIDKYISLNKVEDSINKYGHYCKIIPHSLMINSLTV